MSNIRFKSAASAVAALVGTAFGQFSFSGPDAYATPLRPAGVAVGDFDGVNGSDFAVVTNNPDKVSLMFNTGADTFTGSVDIFIGGGMMDIASANGDGNISLLAGNGAGGFTPMGTLAVNPATRPDGIIAADLDAWAAGDPSADVNGDGSLDTLDVLVFLNSWNAGC
ncbi:MAG: GC-type dockerin domain-anchored protein [Planctomycetota bacterium]|nr:GC-type dockerin domain-anchored protein [Planctomycetota bacterium]